MATSRSRRRLWTYGATVALVVAILYTTGGVVSGLRTTANLVVTPFSWSVNAVARPLGHLFAGAVNYSDVVAQNEKLRYELGQARLQADEHWALERQLQEMTTELNVPFVGGLTMVAAQVTTLSPTSFAATVDISKGRNDGVLSGMPVVANGGLIGTVISTTPHGATVRLISDVNSSVGVTFGHGTTSLVVSGKGVNNGLGASSVPLATALRPGTLLSTDGLSGGLFPPGLPVARVTTISLTPGAATYDVALRPSADLRHVLYVDVILWEPST
ncbi:MAG TPA: rod shape-determining protein MreC [Acidimicrobiales bacterium]|nr:rod shape-determining protein MreC [Acidimicrobiales bacterium]